MTSNATSTALEGAEAEAVEAALVAGRHLEGPLLPILHEVQDRLGYVPPASVPTIARALDLSRAEVHGVVTFYHHFRQAPAGRRTLRLCRAEACQAVGAEALAAHAKRALGVDFHGTTADREFTLEPVYCLGTCACGPSLMLDDDLHGEVTPERFDALVKRQAR